jgi:hypothetical protein
MRYLQDIGRRRLIPRPRCQRRRRFVPGPVEDVTGGSEPYRGRGVLVEDQITE